MEKTVAKKYTMQDFTTKNIAIIPSTAENAKAFFNECARLGLKWRNGGTVQNSPDLTKEHIDNPQWPITYTYLGTGLSRWKTSSPASIKDVTFINFSDLDIPTIRPNDELHITVNGRETHAVWKQGGKVIGHGVATCSPDDGFDFRTGAQIAMQRCGFLELKAIEDEKAVREVKRPAKAGEWIKALADSKSFPGEASLRFRKGDILLVTSTMKPGDTWYGRGVVYDHPDCKSYVIRNDDYIVLENYQPPKEPEKPQEPQYREVKRRAKVGEKIKVVNPSFSFSEEGDVLTVSTVETGYVAAKDHPYRESVLNHGANYIWAYGHGEYVVLEPITEAHP